MESRIRTFCAPRFIFGISVIALGVILFLDNLEVLEAEKLLRYWSVVLILIGLARLIAPSPLSPRGASPWIWMLAGIVILGVNLGWLRFAIRDLWPVALILLGAWIVFRGFVFRSSLSSGAGPKLNDAGFVGAGLLRDRPQPRADANSTIETFVMWAGVDRKNNSQDFRGGEISAVMGGCELDLRDASIAEGVATMDLFALWGGIEIMVPGDWTVENRVSAILGGVEDSRKTVGSDPKKRLVLKGAAVMGGIEITN